MDDEPVAPVALIPGKGHSTNFGERGGGFNALLGIYGEETTSYCRHKANPDSLVVHHRIQ
jgi:hypothetical protein